MAMFFIFVHFLLLAYNVFFNNLFHLMIILIISLQNNGDLMHEPLFIKIIKVACELFITLSGTSYRALLFRDMKNKFADTSVCAKYRRFENGDMTEHGRTRETIYHLGVYNLGCRGLELLVKG